MTQPTERRFVMEPRLDAEVAALEAVDATKLTVTLNAPADNQAILYDAGTSQWKNTELTQLDIPSSAFKEPVKAATTANITLSAPQTIDGIALVAGDRVLVKNQTTTSANGIYVVQAAAWTRSTDADTIGEIAGAVVPVDSGTQGGLFYHTTIKSTDTLGTTAMTWGRIWDSSATIPLGNGGTSAGLTAVNGGVVYSTASAMAITPVGTANQVLKSNAAAAPTWQTLDLTYLPDAAFKKTVVAATTANITLSAPQTIDGISVIANDRVLVKNQTAPAENGIYQVNASTWTRTTDADAISEIAGGVVNVDSGTQGGQLWTNSMKLTDTLGTTAMNWYRVLDSSSSIDLLGDVAITSPADKQTLVYESATSLWKNKVASGGVTVGATAPSTPISGDAWFDSNDGTLYVYYNDGNTSQWVQVQANSALEGSILARLTALEVGTTGPNYFINGAFDIWQRGTSFAAPASKTYTADRCFTLRDGTGATVTISQQAFTAGAAPVSGYEGTYFYRYAQSVAGTTGTYSNILTQPIENVRTLAGQTVTVSFWAKADAARSVNVILQQNFGTGGSPSATVNTSAVSGLAFTTSWARYSASVTLPSISGKTLGTNNDHFLGLTIQAVAVNTVQTIDIWGVQVEQGSTATAFRTNAPSIQAELAACQRYYFRAGVTALYGCIATGFQSTTTGIIATRNLPVTMRSVPSVTSTSVEWSDDVNFNVAMTGLAVTAGSDTSMVRMTAAISANGSSLRPGVIRASTTAGYLDFSAEF